MTKLQRRVRAVEKMATEHPFGSQTVRTWQNVRRELIREAMKSGRKQKWIYESMPVGEEWKAIKELLSSMAGDERKKWETHMRQAKRKKDLSHKRHKFVSQKWTPPVTHLVLEGKETCDQKVIGKHINDYWKKIWAKPRERNRPMEKTFIDSIKPVAQWPMRKLEMRDLRKYLSKEAVLMELPI
jgi:hypothetical protein